MGIYSATESQVLEDVRGISAGTLATLTGKNTYEEIDRIHDAWVVWAKERDGEFANWIEAWEAWREDACA